jgi:hypothetical protein
MISRAVLAMVASRPDDVHRMNAARWMYAPPTRYALPPGMPPAGRAKRRSGRQKVPLEEAGTIGLT